LSTDLEKLLTYLEVEAIDKYLFVGKSPSFPPRIFGGQVLAQALSAALRTVDSERTAHSMHAYFLRPGDPTKQIIYEVDPIRDGRSFTTRRVVAKQEGKAIFNTSVSFQTGESGLSHQATMPDVPPPEEVESDNDYMRRISKEAGKEIRTPFFGHIERRSVVKRNYLEPESCEPVQHIWFRAPGNPGDDITRHQTLLAYISDFGLLGTAMFPHPITPRSSNVQEASLDHALWLHRPFRADEYLLYTMDSPNASQGRGFSRGSFFTRDGTLVASTAQECLLRIHEA
jgi:acyl-CoA thioesterase-2